MQKRSLFIVCAACMLAMHVIVVEGKRSFSIGRSRKKPANINVRRKGAVPDGKPPVASPPEYSAPGGPRQSSGFDAPPSYASVARGNPPSYADATRGANYPRQQYSSHVGHSPQYGANSPSSYGLGSAQSTNPGLYSGHQMAGGGMMGGYGGYGYGSSSPFSFGNVLTGLAVWNLARGFGSHGRTEHIYVQRQQDQSSPASVAPANPTDEVLPQIPQKPLLLTTIAPITHDILAIDDVAPVSSTLQPNVEYTTDHPSLWIYAVNAVPIRTEVVVADRSSFV